MVEVVDGIGVRVSSAMNPWMDCIFVVKEENIEEAKEVLLKAWNDYWEDDDGWCFGDFLETRMDSSGIPFTSYYESEEEE